MSLNTAGFEGQLTQEDITPQIYFAHRNKIDFKKVPVSIQQVGDVPAFIFDLGRLKGVLPVHESGYFDGSLEDYESLNNKEKAQISQIMARAFASGNPLWIRVLKIENDVASLSRKEALKSVRARTLDFFKVKDEKELIGRTLKAVVTRVTKNGAYFDLGGIEAFMPRSEIAHGGPYPHNVLVAGRPDENRVNGFNEVKVIDVKDTVIISRKACLSVPVSEVKEGTVLRGRVTNFTKSGRYVVVSESGLSVFAFKPHYLAPPEQHSIVTVRVLKVTDKAVTGRIIG